MNYGVQFRAKAIPFVFVCSLLLPTSLSNFYYGFSDERPFQVRTTRFVCLGPRSTKYIVIHECSLKLLRNGSSLASFNATILQPLSSVWATMKIMYKSSSHVFQPMLGIDESASVCHLLGTEYKTGKAAAGNMFYTAFRTMMKHYTPQLLRPCPIVVSVGKHVTVVLTLKILNVYRATTVLLI